MRVRYSCGVTSRTHVGPMTFKQVDELMIILEGDERGVLKEMSIEYETTDPEETPKVEIDGNRSNLKIGGDPSRYDRILRLFHSVESALTLVGTQRVHYEDITQNWLPDNEEESKSLHVFNFKATRKEPEEPLHHVRESFIEGDLTKIWRLEIPLAFFREGRNEFLERRYINAFQDFYFVIEGLFGEGKTKNVEDAMKASKDLREYCEIVLQSVSRDQEFESRVVPLFASLKVKLDVDGLIDFIVKYRHRLHHFWVDKREWYGNPFNHEEFRDPALILMILTRITLEIEESKAYGLWKG